MPKHLPILLRVFKEETELEVWKQDTTGHFQILKIYPICRWSGDLGPKLHEGDRQTPESFCTITPDLMNPNSNYYLAINTGFPNSFDKANNHDGTLLDAEDALIAALKVKMQRPEALIAYVSQQNKRGDTRHPMRRLSSENA